MRLGVILPDMAIAIAACGAHICPVGICAVEMKLRDASFSVSVVLQNDTGFSATQNVIGNELMLGGHFYGFVTHTEVDFRRGNHHRALRGEVDNFVALGLGHKGPGIRIDVCPTLVEGFKLLCGRLPRSGQFGTAIPYARNDKGATQEYSFHTQKPNSI